jgi:AraC-like DNA-binding protein
VSLTRADLGPSAQPRRSWRRRADLDRDARCSAASPGAILTAAARLVASAVSADYAARVAAAPPDSELVDRAPHPALSGLVESYFGYRERTGFPVRRLEIPVPGAVLIFQLGPPIHVGHSPHDPSAASGLWGDFVGGICDRCVVTETSGEQAGVQVNLTPIGAYMLLQTPLYTLANRAADLDDVLGATGRVLAARLREAPDWESRFRILDAVITARVAGARRPSPGFVWAWRRLEASGGAVRVGTLADELGWSRRRLAAEFREQAGVPAKTVARLIRFRRAASLLGSVPLAEAAYACGYYDQAHFNRDFADFAASTPTQFLARRLPDLPGVGSD